MSFGSSQVVQCTVEIPNSNKSIPIPILLVLINCLKWLSVLSVAILPTYTTARLFLGRSEETSFHESSSWKIGLDSVTSVWDLVGMASWSPSPSHSSPGHCYGRCCRGRCHPLHTRHRYGKCCWGRYGTTWCHAFEYLYPHSSADPNLPAESRYFAA